MHTELKGKSLSFDSLKPPAVGEVIAVLNFIGTVKIGVAQQYARIEPR